ncbi:MULTISPECIES: threonine/serine exporter family protein [unclassified Paenibacillus]|uniref:threonine/serine exporter family protein n=1 Tax=unclassified Paenibacillus TaxID=185978 RepID=UPI001C1170D2|nr:MULTISPECIES: threonine/serine exporter family protein [unclassified Paenibacillus]MBU5442034.1 threonine/serine exporter family protein [Paenibacillus sp. MSJ-34]CAH0120466.1 hypothetical protein PAE9249_02985 [Paenibacillus sp. CECT 9249]
MLIELVVSFIASAAFAIIFNVPRQTLLQCGFVGMFGWIVYILSLRMDLEAVPATLLASFVVAVVSQLFAKIYKTPIIVFNVAGIIPLVPGGLAYDSMRNVVESRYDIALQLAVKALLISGAIAVGLIFSEVIYQLIRRASGFPRSRR